MKEELLKEKELNKNRKVEIHNSEGSESESDDSEERKYYEELNRKMVEKEKEKEESE